jgi:hypothetical protein
MRLVKYKTVIVGWGNGSVRLVVATKKLTRNYLLKQSIIHKKDAQFNVFSLCTNISLLRPIIICALKKA